jgi:ubiquinone/menaquinone biosynthesis C-methylase UbiE
MNRRQSKLTDWGLKHVSIDSDAAILDIGCGGGRTIHKLAAIATKGKVYGVDSSETSVAASRKANEECIKSRRVEILHGSVSHLPFPDQMFALATAVVGFVPLARALRPWLKTRQEGNRRRS